jgi:hypothetical protein
MWDRVEPDQSLVKMKAASLAALGVSGGDSIVIDGHDGKQGTSVFHWPLDHPRRLWWRQVVLGDYVVVTAVIADKGPEFDADAMRCLDSLKLSFTPSIPDPS